MTTTLAAAESLGPLPGAGGERCDTWRFGDLGGGLGVAELDEMAKIEHTLWMRYLQDNGWRYGLQRDDRHRIHPSMRAWDDLTPADQVRHACVSPMH